MQPRRCSSTTDRSKVSPKNVRIATDGRSDHGYRYSQLHVACLRLGAAYGLIAARKTAQITTILAITSPANGSTVERIDALVVASTEAGRVARPRLPLAIALSPAHLRSPD